MEHGEKSYRELAGKMVWQAREHMRLSQTAFGRKLGQRLGRPAIHRGVLGRYETGEDAIPGYYLLAIKDMAGLSLDSLFDEVDIEGLRADFLQMKRELDLIKRQLRPPRASE